MLQALNCSGNINEVQENKRSSQYPGKKKTEI